MCRQVRKWICGCHGPPLYVQCNDPSCVKKLPFRSDEPTHTIPKICLRGDPAQWERRASVKGDSIQDELDAAGWTREAIRQRAKRAFQVCQDRFGSMVKGVQHADNLSLAMLNGDDEGEGGEYAKFPTNTVGTFGSAYVTMENVQQQADTLLTTWAAEWYSRVWQAECVTSSPDRGEEGVRYKSVDDARRRADSTMFKKWAFCQTLAILESHGEETGSN